MSVLDDFMRIRLYRKQAAEFQWLADNASIASVQRRYRAIARHYSELADREERADKTRMAERLRQLRLKREEVGAQVRQSGEANDSLALHRWRLRIFNFDPMRRTPGAIGRTNPLANDALATKSTGFAVDNHAVLVKTLVENETELRAA